MALLAGQSVGLVNEIRSAGDIVWETFSGAELLIHEVSTEIWAYDWPIAVIVPRLS